MKTFSHVRGELCPSEARDIIVELCKDHRIEEAVGLRVAGSSGDFSFYLLSDATSGIYIKSIVSATIIGVSRSDDLLFEFGEGEFRGHDAGDMPMKAGIGVTNDDRGWWMFRDHMVNSLERRR